MQRDQETLHIDTTIPYIPADLQDIMAGLRSVTRPPAGDTSARMPVSKTKGR